MSIWPEADAKLRARWAEGVPCAKIGLELGVSAHAVIGRAHRIHLPEHALATGRGYPLSNLPPKQRRVAVPGNATTLPKLGPAQAWQKPEPPPIPRDTCQFISGDTRSIWSFCGEPSTEPGSPWCAKHKRVVYQPRSSLRAMQDV